MTTEDEHNGKLFGHGAGRDESATGRERIIPRPRIVDGEEPTARRWARMERQTIVPFDSCR